VLQTAVANAPETTAFTRAKTQLKAESVFAQDGLFPLANLIASLYARGQDEQVFYDWSARIEEVTPQQAQSAAQKVITAKRAVTGTLLPAATEAPHAPTP
jgi:zinc protease